MQGSVQPGDEFGGVLALALDADFQGPQTADTKPGLHVPHHGTEEDTVREKLLVPVFAFRGEHAAEDIAMPAEVLRAGVHDQIRAEEERILQAWRGEGAIDDEERAARVCFLRVVCDVEGCAFGVDRCFEEDHVAGLEVFRVAVEV